MPDARPSAISPPRLRTALVSYASIARTSLSGKPRRARSDQLPGVGQQATRQEWARNRACSTNAIRCLKLAACCASDHRPRSVFVPFACLESNGDPTPLRGADCGRISGFTRLAPSWLRRSLRAMPYDAIGVLRFKWVPSGEGGKTGIARLSVRSMPLRAFCACADDNHGADDVGHRCRRPISHRTSAVVGATMLQSDPSTHTESTRTCDRASASNPSGRLLCPYPKTLGLSVSVVDT